MKQYRFEFSAEFLRNNMGANPPTISRSSTTSSSLRLLYSLCMWCRVRRVVYNQDKTVLCSIRLAVGDCNQDMKR